MTELTTQQRHDLAHIENGGPCPWTPECVVDTNSPDYQIALAFYQQHKLGQRRGKTTNYYLITRLGRTLLPADTWEEAQVEGKKLKQALGLSNLEILVVEVS